MTIRIALAGNPNSGKTTLFNALTGSNQYVGNWPGVTVEKKEGKLKGHQDVLVTDLPGIYSLSPYTLEEVVSRNYLIQEKPDVILNVIDGTNLERNLYLTTQLCELGIPVVLAVNMMDLVEKNEDQIHIDQLSQQLGIPVVEISAIKQRGIQEAAQKAIDQVNHSHIITHHFNKETEKALREIENLVSIEGSTSLKRWYSIKLFERDEKVVQQVSLDEVTAKKVEEIITRCEKEWDDDSESFITSQRYDFLSSIIQQCQQKKNKHALSVSDKIDQVVTNRWLALPIFALVMVIVYGVSVTTVGTLLTDWTNDVLFGGMILPAASSALEAMGVAAWLQGLVVDGILSGVGAVLGFVPQMLVLFFFLAFLEGCGYMARIAFLMDRVFRRFGLSGKSFIPMLIGTGCGVPGIMASRTIENENDRRMTIMTTTFIPCGAKLPIIALISGALFADAWWVGPSAYFIGIAAIICSGILLKKTKLFSGNPAPFVMELPTYHFPSWKNVLMSTWERGSSFIKKAGTIILLSTIVVWFLSRFGFVQGQLVMLDEMQMNESLLAVFGSSVAWIFTPLGWGDWRAAVAAVTGLIAKENVVSTFGILYGVQEVSENGLEIWSALQAALLPAAAYSFLVFNLLCAPCFAAMGAMKRELNSRKWFAIALGYQTGLAYLVSLCIYQLTLFVTGSSATVWTLIAILLVVAFLYMLVRPQQIRKKLVLNKAS